MSTHTTRPTRPSPGRLFPGRSGPYLLPYVLPLTGNFQLAQAEIVETLASYGARTRSEMINAARIIALSLTSLELLGQAKATTDMPPDVRLLYIASANSLARTCHQNEVTLAKRLACEVPGATVTEPVDDLSRQDADAALQEAQAKIDSYRNRLSGARPAAGPHAVPGSHPDPTQRPWSSAMINTLIEQAAAPGPAA
jgi:hypothetical protein